MNVMKLTIINNKQKSGTNYALQCEGIFRVSVGCVPQESPLLRSIPISFFSDDFIRLVFVDDPTLMHSVINIVWQNDSTVAQKTYSLFFFCFTPDILEEKNEHINKRVPKYRRRTVPETRKHIPAIWKRTTITFRKIAIYTASRYRSGIIVHVITEVGTVGMSIT